MFTPRDELAEELSVASKKAGEKFWCMPMEEGYWEFMKFNIADFVNTGSRTGGSITAALFLKEVIFTPSGLLACFPSFLHK
jgi:leucyl aminopeptidase